MRNFRTAATWVVILAACGAQTGCGSGQDGQWRAMMLTQIHGFDAPESAFVVPATGQVYVSNIVLAPEGDDSRYIATDGTGFITSLRAGGQIDHMRWAQSSDAAPLHSIKGICVTGGILYVADIDRVRRISVRTGKAIAPIVIPGASFLNDVASDGKYVYVSDTGTGKIHRIYGNDHTAIPGPESANGIAFAGGKMFVVSWELHEIYEVDPTGKTDPIPFGLADKFGGLDGIVALPDGKFLVSDLKAGKIDVVSQDRKTVRTLLNIREPADIAVDHERGVLYVPLLSDNTLGIYKLWKD